MTDSTKRWLEPKDYITIGISSLALVVSATGAYLGVLRTTEAASIVWVKEPLPTLSTGNSLTIPAHQDGEIVLANLGNRAVLISYVAFSYHQPVTAMEPKCPESGGVAITTDFEPTVLKAQDLMSKALKLKSARLFSDKWIEAKKEDNGSFTFPLETHNGDKEEVVIDVCLHLFASTPSNAINHTVQPVLRARASKSGSFWIFGHNEGVLFDRPITIVNKTGTIFGD